MIDLLRQIRNSASTFSREAHDLLGKQESSVSRVISLVATWKQLRGLSLKQNDLLGEALLGVERGLYRSAHVIGWAGFMDFLEEKLAEDRYAKLHAARPSWANYKTVDDVRESIVEYQIVEAARDVGLLKKAEAKALLGLLSKRNECAHPGAYAPSLNETLGFVAELLNRIESIQPRTL